MIDDSLGTLPVMSSIFQCACMIVYRVVKVYTITKIRIALFIRFQDSSNLVHRNSETLGTCGTLQVLVIEDQILGQDIQCPSWQCNYIYERFHTL